MLTLQLLSQIIEFVGAVGGFQRVREALEDIDAHRHRNALRTLGITEEQAKKFFGLGGFLTAEAIRYVLGAGDYLLKRPAERWLPDGHIKLNESAKERQATWLFFTTHRVLCVRNQLDSSNLLRWTEHVTDVTRLRVSGNSAVVEIQGERMHRWRYSRRMHANPKRLADMLKSYFPQLTRRPTPTRGHPRTTRRAGGQPDGIPFAAPARRTLRR